MTRRANAAELRELLRVVDDALDVPEDRPGVALGVVVGVWAALKVVVADRFSADSVRWAAGALRILGRGPPDDVAA